MPARAGRHFIMTLSGSRPAAGWALVAMVLAALFATEVRAQQTPPPPPTQTPPPAQTPPAQPPAQTAKPEEADPLKLKGDVPVLIVNQIDAAKTAEFEAAWAAIREKLSKSQKPELKAFADSLGKMYKVSLPTDQASPVAIYVFMVDQPSTVQSYHPVKVLYESGEFERADADMIFGKLKDAYKNINAWPLTKIGS
jgi:hypothetical protein